MCFFLNDELFLFSDRNDANPICNLMNLRNFNQILSDDVVQVNRIRELPTKMNIIATHTDSPDVCPSVLLVDLHKIATC